MATVEAEASWRCGTCGESNPFWNEDGRCLRCAEQSSPATATAHGYADEAQALAEHAASLTVEHVPATAKTRQGSERDLATREATLTAYQGLTAHMAAQRVTRRTETWRAWADVLGIDDGRDFRSVRPVVERRLNALARWGVASWQSKPDAYAKRRVKRRADGTLYVVGGGTVTVWLVSENTLTR
jgi:hypothetical protein